MESINKFLKDDEKILYQRSLLNPAHKKIIKRIMIFIRISPFLFVAIVLFIILGFTNKKFFFISIFLISFSVVFGFVTLGVYLSYYRYKKVLKLKLKQIKSYEDIYVLTSKRWIQRCLDVLNINESTFPLEITKIIDIVIIDFNQIDFFFSKRQGSLSGYFIGFNLKFPLVQGIYIPCEVFPDFIKILKKVLPIKREIHAKYGLIYYYRN